MRVALVTGGNRGIGLEIARGLARAGLSVMLTSRELAQADEACTRLAKEGARNGPEPVELDVTDEASVRALAPRLSAGLDVLVNNAGVALDGFDTEVARRTLATNYFGPLAVLDAVRPRLRSGARIVMVTSGMGDRSLLGSELRARLDDPALDRAGLDALMHAFVADVAAGRHRERGWPSNAYAVSKIGLTRVTQILARSLPAGMAINAACPGWVRTDMGGAAAPRSPAEGADTPLWLALLEPGGPSGGLFRDREPVSW